MLAELVGWYAGRDENRRRYPRIKRDYVAQYSVDAGHSWRPLAGVDLSGGGMCANSPREIPNVILDIAMTLRGKNVRLKAQPMWHTDVSQGKERVICYGFQFTSVGGDDWDAIMQWITGSDEPEMPNMPQARIDEAEVAHFIPRDLREKLLNELVQRNRYDRKSSPTAQFDYGGITHANGHAMHKLTIHTKVKVSPVDEMRYSTRFLCDESGNEIIVQN
jgi:hypothetical protein